MIKGNQLGFSIIEVVLAIGIIAVIGVVTSNLFTRTFQTSSDTELTSKLKQNGSVASERVAEAIRKAESVVCYGPAVPPYKWIVIRTAEGKYNLFRFVDPIPPSGTPVTQNGYIARQEDLDPDLLSSFCVSNPPNFVTDVPLTDRDLSTGVSISSGEFKKISGSVDKHTVTITFDVDPAGNQTGAIGVVNIQTTVQVR